jgi:hypothetical protein
MITVLRGLSGALQIFLVLLLIVGIGLGVLWDFSFASHLAARERSFTIGGASLLLLLLAFPWLVLAPVIWFGFRLALRLSRTADALRARRTR